VSDLNQFVGRENDLQDLVVIWEEVKRSREPKVVTILGDTGYGKTRLISEFYSRISQDPRENQGYWPEKLSANRTNIDLNPIIQNCELKGTIPYLWWGIRGTRREGARNGVQDEGCALSRSVPFLRIHLLDAIIRREKSRKNTDLRNQLYELAFNLIGIGISNFLPQDDYNAKIANFSNILQIVKNGYDIGRSALNNCADSQLPTAEKLAQDSLGFLRSFIDKTRKELPTIPVIIVLDDAQWLDPITLKCLHDMIEFAVKKKAPLFVIATHWEAEWKVSANLALPQKATLIEWRAYRQIENQLKTNHPSASADVFKELRLGKMDSRKMVRSTFGNLDEEIIDHIANVSDGNAEIASQMISALSNSSRRKWFKNEDIGNSLTEKGKKAFFEATKDIPRIFKEKVLSLQDNHPEVATILTMGAVCADYEQTPALDHAPKGSGAQWFIRSFTEELYLRICKKLAGESLREGDDPHNVISLQLACLQTAEFRHINFPHEFRLSLDPDDRKQWKSGITTLLCEWINSDKIPCDEVNHRFFVFAEHWLGEWLRENSDDCTAGDVLAKTRLSLLKKPDLLGTPAKVIETSKSLLEHLKGKLLQANPGSPVQDKVIAEMFGVTLLLARSCTQDLNAEDGLAVLEKWGERYPGLLKVGGPDEDNMTAEYLETLSYVLGEVSNQAGIPKASDDREQDFLDEASPDDLQSRTVERPAAAKSKAKLWEILAGRHGLESPDAIRAGFEYFAATAEGAAWETNPKHNPITILAPLCVLAKRLEVDDPTLLERAYECCLICKAGVPVSWGKDKTGFCEWGMQRSNESNLSKLVKLAPENAPSSICATLEFLGQKMIFSATHLDRIKAAWNELIEEIGSFDWGVVSATKNLIAVKTNRLGGDHPHVLMARLSLMLRAVSPMPLEERKGEIEELIQEIEFSDRRASIEAVLMCSKWLRMPNIHYSLRCRLPEMMEKARGMARDFYGPGGTNHYYLNRINRVGKMSCVRGIINSIDQGMEHETLGGRSRFSCGRDDRGMHVTTSEGNRVAITREAIEATCRRYEELKTSGIVNSHGTSSHLAAGQYTKPSWADCPDQIACPYIAALIAEMDSRGSASNTPNAHE